MSSPTEARGVKRCWQDWEDNDLKRLMSMPPLSISLQTEQEDDLIAAQIEKLYVRLEEAIDKWTSKPSVDAKRALLIVALAVGEDNVWSKQKHCEYYLDQFRRHTFINF